MDVIRRAFALPLAACAPFVGRGLMAAAFGSPFAAAGTTFSILGVGLALALVDATLTTLVLALGGDRRFAVAVTLIPALIGLYLAFAGWGWPYAGAGSRSV